MTYFNTLYVSVQVNLWGSLLYLSSISIHYMFQFKLFLALQIVLSVLFQYIICFSSRMIEILIMGLLINFNTLYVSVQVIADFFQEFFGIFQYIICFSSRIRGFKSYLIHKHFNTLYVSVQVVPNFKPNFSHFYFNTLYVSVQEDEVTAFISEPFISIHYMFQFKKLNIRCKQLLKIISIHYMFQFKWIELLGSFNKKRFQYIICFSSRNLKTANLISSDLFQYIICFSSSL